MRTSVIRVLVPAVVLAAACSRGSQRTAMSDDLKKDLQLASQNQNFQISADEVGPQSKPQAAPKLRRAPGPRVIRTQHPHVRASVQPQQVAEAPETQQVAQTTVAPTPASVPAPAPAPAPAAQPTQDDGPPLARPGTGSGNGNGAGNGGGEGPNGVWGTGAIIRGGVVDDDHCDPRGHRRGSASMPGPGQIGAAIGIGILGSILRGGIH